MLSLTKKLCVDVSVKILYLAFISHFIAEEGYCILTETSTQSFLVSDKNFYFLLLSCLTTTIVFLTSLTLWRGCLNLQNSACGKILHVYRCNIDVQNIARTLNLNPNYLAIICYCMDNSESQTIFMVRGKQEFK